MNNQRRKDIRKAIELMNEALAALENAKSILETASEEEREAYENLPESIQYGERGDKMSENCDYIDNVVDSIDIQIGEITDCVDSLENGGVLD